MTDEPTNAMRAGTIRAVKPRALRRAKTAKIVAPVAAMLAVAGMTLVAIAQTPAAAEASILPSVDQIAQQQAQGYSAALVTGQDAAPAPTLGRGEVGSVEVATPEPKPTQSSSGGSSGGSTNYGPTVPASESQAIAAQMISARGWGDEQFTCLVKLWDKESGWRVNAENSSSGAYGIPQSLPGNKMAAAGDDWRTNPATQISWGINHYIAPRYGTPCAAWEHSQAKNWY